MMHARESQEKLDDGSAPSHQRATATFAVKAAVARSLLDKQRVFEAEERRKRQVAASKNADAAAKRSAMNGAPGTAREVGVPPGSPSHGVRRASASHLMTLLQRSCSLLLPHLTSLPPDPAVSPTDLALPGPGSALAALRQRDPCLELALASLCGTPALLIAAQVQLG